MTKISDALTYGLTIRESATDGSDFTNPVADYRRVFLGEDGQLHARDSAGNVTALGGTETLPVSIIAAKGDIIAGTANDTAAVLTVGANDYVLTADDGEATGLKWAEAGGSLPLADPGDILYMSDGTYTNQATAALGATATASSTYGGWPASQAINGNDSDGWATDSGSLPQWIKVDLGAVRSIDRIRMYAADTYYATAYDVEYSDADSGYTTWGSRSSAPAEDIFTMGGTVAARWWKFTATTLNSSGWHIHSLEIATLSGAALARLPIGAEGQVLTVTSGLPSWETP